MMRLETEDGKFVANVRPLLPLEPTEVLLWGERFFTKAKGHRSINPPWREIRVTIVVDDEGKA